MTSFSSQLEFFLIFPHLKTYVFLQYCLTPLNHPAVCVLCSCYLEFNPLPATPSLEARLDILYIGMASSTVFTLLLLSFLIVPPLF